METTFIYSALAAAAAGLLLYFFLRRRDQGTEAPADGSVFRKFGANVRLRDIFRLAAMLEEKGKDFYLKMEKKVSDPETKKLCAWLAGEEEKHRQFVQDHLDRWRPLGPHLIEWPAFLEQVKREGFFSEPPAASASEEELAAYAISQEIKTARFYAVFEAAFPQAWKRARLDRLVQEERSHEAKLRAAYPGIK